MSEVSGIVRTLGGPRLVPARSLEELRRALRDGLPFLSLAAVARGFEIAAGDLAALVGIPPRTLARRKKDRRLSPDESDRLFRLGRIATLAEEVLGTRAKAAGWLHAPNRALGGRVPLSELDTDLGAEQVETVLLRLSHGVVA